MSDSGKLFIILIVGVLAAVISGIIASQLRAPIFFAIYALVVAIVCIIVESVAKKTWTAFLVGSAFAGLYYLIAPANQFAWILFLCGTVLFTFIASRKEPESS